MEINDKWVEQEEFETNQVLSEVWVMISPKQDLNALCRGRDKLKH